MLLEEVIDDASCCRQCELHINRDVPVFSKGNRHAKLMICGMCPGPKENECGIPFIGKSGELLDTMLLDAGLTKNDVYITNIVKCFVKPGLPLKETWVLQCLPYLINEISIIHPRVIITLGTDASRALLNKPLNTPLFKMRNKIYHYTHSIDILSTYHPSYFIRHGGRNHIHYKRGIEDFILASNIIKGDIA